MTLLWLLRMPNLRQQVAGSRFLPVHGRRSVRPVPQSDEVRSRPGPLHRTNVVEAQPWTLAPSLRDLDPDIPFL